MSCSALTQGAPALTSVNAVGDEGDIVDVIELRARLRALARDPEEMARRTGLPVGTIDALLRGEMANITPMVRQRLATALTPSGKGDDQRDGQAGQGGGH